MSLTLGAIATLVKGELRGDAEIVIEDAAIIRDVQVGQITLADNQRLAESLADCPAVAVVVPRDAVPDGIAYIVVDDVHAAFARIVAHFRPICDSTAHGVSESAQVSSTAVIATGAIVHPNATIGDDVHLGAGTVVHSGVQVMAGCRIGENVTIFPNAVLYENTLVGHRVIIHAGVVLGAHGFGYNVVDGKHVPSAQLGNVEIGDDVEIGACTTIDRGTYGPTVIGAGTKIDNQVMIAHNCRIGRHNLLCSQVGIAGSVTTGDYVVMAGQVGLRDHIHIHDGVVLGAKAGVMNDVPAGATYYGIPATPEREQLLKQAAWSKLPAMRKEFKAVQKQLAGLTRQDQNEAA
jgi:UDP-3-O-[3-hydroxymyristoyl] glucosamine N-acyltransferase